MPRYRNEIGMPSHEQLIKSNVSKNEKASKVIPFLPEDLQIMH